jgi:probable HAF family extracellular repeat protein
MFVTRTQIAFFAAVLCCTARMANADSLSNYTFVPIDVPGLTNPEATGINNVGEVVGYGTGTGNEQVGFLDNAGQFTTIFVPGSTGTVAYGLNDSGQIVGWYTDSSGTHGFEYSQGSYTTIDDPDGLAGTTALVGINDSGEIAGNAVFASPVFTITQGFVYAGGSFQLITMGPNAFVVLGGINNLGQVVGGGGGVARPNGGIFGTVSGVGFYPQFATAFDAINDEDQIVAHGGFGDELLSSPDGPVVFQIIPPLLPPPYNEGVEVFGINDAGWLVGSYTDSPGVGHALELTPTPEPAYLALLACALLAMGFKARRRKV